VSVAERPYINRELSWLNFNRRVLQLAQDPTVGTTGPDGLTPTEALGEIHRITSGLYKELHDTFRHHLVPELQREGITYSDWSTLDADDRSWLDEQFQSRLFPVLTPLAVDPSHPFPYISDLSLSLAVFARSPQQERVRFARVKIPPILPRFVVMPDNERFVPLEQVIARHLGVLFRGMDIVAHCPFRVTRDNDFDVDDDADDLLEAIETQLVQRRFGAAVRLEAERRLDADALELIQTELELDDDDVYLVDGPLDMTGLFALADLDRPDLKWRPYQAITPPALQGVRAGARSFFSVLREGDVLVHHPYESFAESVEEFIRAAAADPRVLTIKMTMYRTARESPIVQSLIQAAESGKQVVVLVELRARFDEQANVEWAKVLERSGVHVAYGVVGLKTHCKTALVVRDENGVIRRYAHIGTGNYNSTTARIYEDYGLFTADEAIGTDLTELFNVLTGFSDQRGYRRLVVSPHSSSDRICELIAGEAAHPDGHIVMKMNSLVDRRVIDALYDASAAGTRIDLIVRGVCCLVPGVPKVSKNISVRSIVGRYLEHSRVYRFGTAERGYTFLIGSADMMPRNLEARVEALVPVTGHHEQTRLSNLLDVLLADNVRAWSMGRDGEWERIPTTDHPVEAHVELQRRARRRARRMNGATDA
jgi:polyphosphate kinase